MKRRLPAAWPIAIYGLFLLVGCATVDVSDSELRRFFDTVKRYPGTREPLMIRKLTATSFNTIPNVPDSPDVFIMVHPAYSLFFGDPNKSKYTNAKYALLARQFEIEARFISEASSIGKIVVLVIPGNYQSESVAPQSYTAYLNTTAAGQTVFYLFSESARSGSISMNDMVDLYRFLQGIKAGKILIGGGYIGRCQKEFYNELTTYFSEGSSYIVPELSTISPDDISETEAANILESIERQDYTTVRKFIDKKLDEAANVLSLPQKKEL